MTPTFPPRHRATSQAEISLFNAGAERTRVASAPASRRQLAAFILILALPLLASAQTLTSTEVPDPTASYDPNLKLSDPHPALPDQDHWAWTLLLIIALGFFIPAAIVGPVSRCLAADELPELHIAQEKDPHAASQHEPGHSLPGSAVSN